VETSPVIGPARQTDVYLITGFLGSGKTTFLNRLIRNFPEGRKLTILMNEFGEVGVDGAVVERDDLSVMEISKGSIFCICVKTDFIKGLLQLARTIQPDILIMESTGVANPADLKKDLALPIFHGCFRLVEQVCLIDAVNFFDEYQTFPSVEKQLESSTLFLINKTDLASPEQRGQIKAILAQYHTTPRCYETTYGQLPPGMMFPGGEAKSLSPSAGPDPSVLSDEEIDDLVQNLLGDPDRAVTPPDRLMSMAYQWQGREGRSFRELLTDMPRVVRAKGFLEDSSGPSLFNYVLGRWRIEKTGGAMIKPHLKNIVVFILPPEDLPELERWADRSGCLDRLNR
jgi:G3E family GTPase